MSRVLMVDDAGLFQMLEGSFLKRLGCEILRAGDGREVVEKATAGAPDLILLDTDRPGLDGPGCLRALKADPALRSIPVLVVTSMDKLPDCAAAGADATITRPVTRGALELALCSLGRVAHRAGQRRSARLPVTVASPAGSVRARLKDISRTGLFLALPVPLPVDAPLSLSLRLPGPGGGRRLSTRGVVVRRVEHDPESHLIPGVGVRFVGLDPATESVIDHYVRATVVDDGGADDEFPHEPDSA